MYTVHWHLLCVNDADTPWHIVDEHVLGDLGPDHFLEVLIPLMLRPQPGILRLEVTHLLEQTEAGHGDRTDDHHHQNTAYHTP